MKKREPKGVSHTEAKSFREGQRASLIAKAAAARGALARQSAAFKEEDSAEAEILTKVLEVVKPALPTICQRIEGWPNRVTQVAQPNLFIEEDGVFGEWGGDGKPKPLTIPEVLDYYPPEDVIEGLTSLLEKQIGGRDASARGVEMRVKKLKAVLALLED